MSQLVDPRGNPISSRDFARKNKNFPLIGELSQPWVNEGGNERRRFPFDNRLNFDTSMLTLDDYRVMREHYQINSSITVLSFMLHQLEWKIECDSIKVAKHVEDNLHRIWTRLVRAFSQAFVFGFSPSALQWENDGPNGRVVINKVMDLRPEDCRVRWKDVKGVTERQGIAKSPKAKVYDGIIQAGAASQIPVDNSLWYPLLMENGDYYGKKLLKSAFQPWFFSSLIHYYSNRYFERFGEPTIIGRAPYDERIDLTGTGQGDGIRGNVLMMGAVNMVRSGSGVVLPNARAMNGLDGVGNYEYTLEYLESQMRGADFERYLSRLDQEISLALFTPLLMMNTADVGSMNLGVVHTQMYKSMINALADDWKEYIDKYVLWPMARWNFGEKAKRPTIRFRKLGAIDAETGRSILIELLRSGNGDKGVKFDLEEVGQIIGMTLEEIEKVTEPQAPAPVGEDPAAPAPEKKAGEPKKDTRVGRPERAKTGKGVDKKAVAHSISDRIAAQFCKALQDDVAPSEFAIDIGYAKQIADAAPDLDYVEFCNTAAQWIREYYESMTKQPDQIKSEIREVIRGGIAGQMGVFDAEAA